MKKTILLLLCIVFVFALSACNLNEPVMYEPNNAVTQPTETIEPTETTTVPTEAPVIQLEAMEEILIPDDLEFYIKESFVNKIIKYPHSTEYWFEAPDGRQFVDIGFAVKNIGSHNVMCDSLFTATLTYANKYVYEGYVMCEDDNISGASAPHVTAIIPLTTEYVHYVFEVPNEVADSNDSLLFEFEIRGAKYSYVVR